MRILPVISLALFLGAGVALAASDEGVNPFRSDSSLDGAPLAVSPGDSERFDRALMDRTSSGCEDHEAMLGAGGHGFCLNPDCPR